ncbi:MAG: O-unit flippase-like protein [Microbacter sp.]
MKTERQSHTMQITKNDVFWNYAATFLFIAGGALLLPFILHKMPAEKVGIWSVFTTITSFVGLIDFGFNPSFTRNVTYVFSGVRSLKQTGHEAIIECDVTVDYGLLGGLIRSMRWFYSRMSIVVFLLLTTLGTYYIHTLLKRYHEPHLEVYVAWGLLIVINTYNLYTLYYDSLLQGKGLIKRSKQIVIIGQSVYLLIASVLILKGFGLIAIVSAQASSVFIVRTLSYRSFFTPAVKQALKSAVPRPKNEILHAVYPNAVKVGLTSLGGFMVTKSAMFIGSLYLTLEQIASYGISMQLIGIIAVLAGIYTSTYQPKIVQFRVEQNLEGIKYLYIRGALVLFLTFVAGGIGLLFIGPWALHLIGSQTQLMPFAVLLLATFVGFLESNHSMAGSVLLTKNEVPFFKASLLSGGFTVLLLFSFFYFTHLTLWAMILAPGIAQAVYQNWKWPFEVIKELNVTFADIRYLVNSKSRWLSANLKFHH